MNSPDRLYDRIAELSEQNDFASAGEELKRLAHLAAASPQNRHTALYLARAAYTFGSNAEASGKTEAADRAFALLGKLIRRFPEEGDIVLEWAQTVFDRLTRCVEHKDIPEAMELYHDLAEIAGRFHHIHDFIALKSGAGFNLACCLGAAGDLKQARAVYSVLAEDAADQAEADDLASFQARAAVNLAVLHADRNDLYTAWKLHADASNLLTGRELGSDIESAVTDLGTYLEQKGKDLECERNLTIK